MFPKFFYLAVNKLITGKTQDIFYSTAEYSNFPHTHYIYIYIYIYIHFKQARLNNLNQQ